jgi:hypothetical protein
VVDVVVAAWDGDVTSTALHRPPPPATARFLDPGWTWRR